MPAVNSNMIDLGTKAPDFRLPATDGSMVQLSDYQDQAGYLVMFICNHCPYVKLVRESLASLGRDYMEKGIAVFAINSNDVDKYPEDSPEKMVVEKEEAGYPFDYLFDATQEVAKAYEAACTPDFYLFDRNKLLVYRGQLDEARPGNGKPSDGRDLRQAMDNLLAGKPVSGAQKPSIGCSIKWKPST